MTLPPDYPFSNGPDGFVNELRDAYRRIQKAIAGSQNRYQPVVVGSADSGSKAYDDATYTMRSGYYKLCSDCIDIWYKVAWSNHNGTGNLMLLLPVNAMGFSTSVWTGNCSLTTTTGSLQPAYLSVLPSTNQGFVMLADGPVAMSASGQLQGYIRYMVQIR